MPRAVTVCRCNGVTKGTIQDAVLAGADDVQKVAARTRATTGCGGCREVVGGILEWLKASEPALGEPPPDPAPVPAPVPEPLTEPAALSGGERRPA
jgi:bacterioferritin-associated ferredoxin